jgi:hypothetical protein
LNFSYGGAIDHWDVSIQRFWKTHIDRYYEYFVLPEKLRNGKVLEIGAEWYSRHIKEIIARDSELTLIDIKDASHPDVNLICNLDHYYQMDMTQRSTKYENLVGYFDAVLSLGVLGFFDFNREMCVNYVDNVSKMAKNSGQAIFKFDVHVMKTHKYSPSPNELIEILEKRFVITETDELIENAQKYIVCYCVNSSTLF